LKLRAKVSVVVLIAVAAAGVLPAVVAQGSPLSDKQAQARALDAQIQANGSKMVTLSEKLNGARIRLDKAQAGIADAERRTAEAQAATDKIHYQLNARAAEIYKGAGTSNPLDAVDVENVTELAARSKYASAAADKDDSLLNRLLQAREILAIQKSQLETQKAAAQSERDAADNARKQLAATTARLNQQQSQVKGELATLISQERARQANAARVRAQTQTRNIRNGGGGGAIPTNFPNAPAPNGRAQIAVDFAKRQVGKGYRYATSGPDTFDCSGLTAAAWAAAGVGLPHQSGQQYSYGTHVAADLAVLKPGDLLFFYDPIHHVALYIGNGKMVHAPTQGVPVQVVNVDWKNIVGATRL